MELPLSLLCSVRKELMGGKGEGSREGRGKKGRIEEGREGAPPIFTGAPHFLIPSVAPA